MRLNPRVSNGSGSPTSDARYDILGARRRVASTVFALATLAAFFTDMPRAEACGGFFAPTQQQQTESTVVTDQRMAFSISQKRTILWDQIRYSGNPSEFVWVLPVSTGSVVELSHDKWIGALDTLSDPTIKSPAVSDQTSGPSGCQGPSVGCGAAEESAYDSPTSSAAPPPVQVVSQSVVGPYETVTLHATNPTALGDWLTSHGYNLPNSVKPVFDSYVAKGMDFLALRLRPGQGVNAMKPIRVITQGADPGLPLRTIVAGASANVRVTLFVVAEGRYHPQNFPDATIDYSQLIWDDSKERSNYQELSDAAMAANGGASFLTEYAGMPGAYVSGTAGQGSTLADLYYGTCTGDIPGITPNNPSAAHITVQQAALGAGAGDSDASTPSGDAGAASDDDSQCSVLDDLALALDGMDPSSVWVTRLRANLPVAAITKDLKLEATSDQTPVPSAHIAATSGTFTAQASLAAKRGNVGSAVLGVLTALFLGKLLRRRSRKAAQGKVHDKHTL
jgi:hypothetical protein